MHFLSENAINLVKVLTIKYVHNKKKHVISFEMAVRVFLDEKRIEKLDYEHSTFENELI